MAERSEQEQQGEQQKTAPDDLKEREYRDKEGNIHHHTRTSREMQEKEGGGSERK